MIEGKKKHLLFIDNREKDVRNQVTPKNVSIDYIFSAFVNGRNNIKPQLYLSIHDEE